MALHVPMRMAMHSSIHNVHVYVHGVCTGAHTLLIFIHMAMYVSMLMGVQNVYVHGCDMPIHMSMHMGWG